MSKQNIRWALLTIALLVGGIIFSLQYKEPVAPSTQIEIEEVVSEPAKDQPLEASPSKKTISAPSEVQANGSPKETPSETLTQFCQLVEAAQSNMPKKKDLQALPDEQVHYTPELIQRAALSVGQIAQAIADNKELVPEGLKFYRDCAEFEDSPNSIRASCYFNHEELIKKFNLKDPSLENDSKISDRVRALAKKL